MEHCIIVHVRGHFWLHEWWGITTQESPLCLWLCYENTREDKSGYNQEDRESSINTLCKTTSSRDQLAHEDGRALALIKCVIWTCFVSLIVMALWIPVSNDWRQP